LGFSFKKSSKTKHPHRWKDVFIDVRGYCCYVAIASNSVGSSLTRETVRDIRIEEFTVGFQLWNEIKRGIESEILTAIVVSVSVVSSNFTRVVDQVNAIFNAGRTISNVTYWVVGFKTKLVYEWISECKCSVIFG
jgi:hypothetical protein